MTFILDKENNDKGRRNPVLGDKLLPSERDACSAALSLFSVNSSLPYPGSLY